MLAFPVIEASANEKPTGDAAVQKRCYIPYAYTFPIHRADRGLIGRKLAVQTTLPAESLACLTS
jgi:hypothetical protein